MYTETRAHVIIILSRLTESLGNHRSTNTAITEQNILARGPRKHDATNETRKNSNRRNETHLLSSVAHYVLTLLYALANMTHTRRLAPFFLHTAQRATVRDLDVHVQKMPPDILNRHPATRVIAHARLAVGERERAPRLARRGKAAAVRRET